MKPFHHEEKESFRELFRKIHADQEEDLFQILEEFLQTEKHVTAGELHHYLEAKGILLPFDTVKQALNMMCRFGFAQKRRFEDGQVRYEHRHLGQHHDHMICTRCGAIAEFQDETLERRQEEVAQAQGFHILQHKMEIYGICAQCMALREGMIPLDSAKPGERVTISEFLGGKVAYLRLMAMGLRTGDSVEVITNDRGQVVIASGFNRLSIAQGLARKVLVRAA